MKQVGGNHYSILAPQPIEVALSLKSGFCLGSTLKYIARQKIDKKEDLQKSITYLEQQLSPQEPRSFDPFEVAKSWNLSPALTKALFNFFEYHHKPSNTAIHNMIKHINEEIDVYSNIDQT